MTQGVLDNGARVVLLPDDGADVAAVYVWMNVGSADEPPGMEGAAHFIEHLVFKGTERFTVGEVAGRIEALGGDLNAWTGFDETVLHATVLGENAPGALEVLAQMMRHATFDADELKREREVVIEEIRGGADDVGIVVGEALYAAAWPGDPYGRSIIGTAASVKGLKRGDLLDFYHRHYVPSNACICVAGRFDEAAVTAAIHREFAGGPPAPVRARADRAPAPRAATRRVRRRFDTHLVRLAFPGFAYADPEAPVADLLAATLGGGSAAPLVVALRELPGCFDGTLDTESEARGGLVVVDAHVAPGAEDAVLEVAASTLAAAAAGRIDRADIARARVGVQAERRFRRQTVDGRAHEACFYREVFGDASAWRAYDQRMAAVTDEEVRALAARMFRPEAALTVALSSRQVRLEPAWRAAPLPARSTGMERIRLRSGATLLVEPDEGNVAALRIVGLGGQLAERPGRPGRTALWARTVARGAGGLDAAAYGRALASLGGSVGALSGRSSQALRAEFPAEGFGPGLELVLLALTAPSFMDREVDRARAALQDDLAARDDDPGERLNVACWAAACHGHPWALDPGGTPSGLARLRRADLIALHRGWARPDNLIFSVVGDVDVDYVRSRLEDATAHLGGARAVADAAPLDWPETRPRRVNLRSERDQAHLVMLWPGLGARDPEAGALDVLVELLGGQSGRLFLELREAEGLAYAVGADSTEGAVGGVVSCAMACDPGRLDEAERRLLVSIGRVAAGDFTVEEVERARAAVLGAVEAELQTAGARASEAAFAERYGLDGARYRTLMRRAAEVTVEDVKRLAAHVFATPRVIGRLAPR